MASPTKAQVLAVLLLLAGATRGTAFGGAFCPAKTASSVYCNSQPCTSDQCVCGLGYTGSSCETDPTGTIATGGAFCVSMGNCNGQPCNLQQCVCSSGSTGSNCEFDLATGAVAPGGAFCIANFNCNGQGCGKTSTTLACVCSSGSTGANCEFVVSPSPSPSPSPVSQSASASPSAASSPSPAASASPSPESTAPPSSSGSNLYYLGFLALLAAIPIAIGVAVWYFWESIVARWYPTPEPVFYPTRPVATDLQPRVVAYLQPSVAYYPPPPPPTPMAP
jgi:hypothetical protein